MMSVHVSAANDKTAYCDRLVHPVSSCCIKRLLNPLGQRYSQTGRSFGWQIQYFIMFGQNAVAGKNVDTSRCWIIFENLKICMQIIGLIVGDSR